MSDARLTELEIKVAFQEDTIKALNDVVYQQQNRIDRLEASLYRTQEAIDATQQGSGAPLAGDEKPPHY